MIDKDIILIPGTTVMYKSATGENILANVVKCDAYSLVTCNVESDIELRLCNWQQSLKNERVVISPN